ncbi:acyl-CoA dehydrogenase [Polycladidibacter hongkongensis]|uniref:acyl-CoA dehydrogenase n=1 Tax=Polycladidibacter hongkongensis TaxID=1647556 RepID=UPI00082E2EEC|nr:acyl-CoA dehydrogenase [Pseudovibrio hongkongensis]
MYRAPLAEIAFTMKNLAGLPMLQQHWQNAEIDEDLINGILAEAGKFAEKTIAPLNPIGDKHPAQLVDGAVKTSPGWAQTYREWCDAGWNSLSGSPEYGGMGLPALLATAIMEMWNGANMAFALGPTLTIGAVEALQHHGSAQLRETYLEKLVSGEWTGTMNLTEPQAGSDLAALRTKAEPQGDGTYKIFGQKIFITYGDHDMSENIVHLVLARLPDAPEGTRGISLFLVPKRLVNEDGTLGALNDVTVAGVEHKMGIHGSPTCTMVYGDNGGAIGYLIGEENKGLACMFTMMNNARLVVGTQGVGIAELASQMAQSYALERKQGKAAKDVSGMSPIAHHPDIKRSLVRMRGLTNAARIICLNCALALDMANTDLPEEEKRFWRERAGLLTPLAKAFSTDIGVEVASEALQVHGGMGYIEETGIAQLHRDVRIAPIYEGTNAIQSIDLVLRKLTLSKGENLRALLAELQGEAEDIAKHNLPQLGSTAAALQSALGATKEASQWLLTALQEKRSDEALAGATPYLRLLSLTYGGVKLAKAAIISHLQDANASETVQRFAVARLFAETILPETAGLAKTITTAAPGILAVEIEELA